jgi:hypothetical protein
VTPSAADPVEAFAECARSFCELVESADELGRGAFAWGVGERLARLYAAGHALPDEPTEGELVDFEVTAAENERSDELQYRVSVKLEGVDFFWAVYDPYDEKGFDPEEVAEYLPADLAEKYRDVLESPQVTEDGVPAPVGCILSDHLMDVYRDIRDGLSLYEAGERESAIWEWRFGFQQSWGIDAPRALQAIHWLTHACGDRSIARDEP